MPTKASETISEFSEKRLWSTLDSISSDIKNIQDDLKEVARIGERVHTHHEILSRHTQILDTIEKRVRDNELWQANFGDKKEAEETIKELRARIKQMEQTTSQTKGEKKAWEPIIRWGFSIIAAIVVFQLTGK